MGNCPNCGVLVEKDSKFCQECGTKIDNSDSNTQTDVSSDYEKNKKCSEIVVTSDDNLTFDFNFVSVRFFAWICSDSIYGACS